MSHFPYTKIMPYDAYFENLENWVNTKQNKDDLIHVYTFLTKHIYKSLFLEISNFVQYSKEDEDGKAEETEEE